MSNPEVLRVLPVYAHRGCAHESSVKCYPCHKGQMSVLSTYNINQTYSDNNFHSPFAPYCDRIPDTNHDLRFPYLILHSMVSIVIKNQDKEISGILSLRITLPNVLILPRICSDLICSEIRQRENQDSTADCKRSPRSVSVMESSRPRLNHNMP